MRSRNILKQGSKMVKWPFNKHTEKGNLQIISGLIKKKRHTQPINNSKKHWKSNISILVSAAARIQDTKTRCHRLNYNGSISNF